MGAKHVDTFDVNLFARYYANFKLAAIQALECDEFLKFFCTRDGNKVNNECFDEIVYKKKIRPLLKKESRLFFDLVYKEVGNGYNFRNSRLFYNNQNSTIEQKKICLYLNNFDKIKKLSTKLNSSIHYQANVVDLPNIVNSKYDYILLSNIQHYADQIFPYDDLSLQKYRDFIQKDLMNTVKANGFIVV